MRMTASAATKEQSKKKRSPYVNIRITRRARRKIGFFMAQNECNVAEAVEKKFDDVPEN